MKKEDNEEFKKEEKYFEGLDRAFSDAAFPVTITRQYTSRPDTSHFTVTKGLSKRELFAAMAMQGMLSNSLEIGSFPGLTRTAIRFADTLLEELEK